MELHEEDKGQDESLCLCRKFVPDEQRVDFIELVTDERTSKRKWAVVLRAHKQCPYHGITVEEH